MPPRTRKTEQPYKAKADISVLMGEEQPSTAPLMLPIDSISLPSSQVVAPKYVGVGSPALDEGRMAGLRWRAREVD